MNRYCFQLRVDPAHLDEYRRRHAAVWPDMLHALRDSGWHNYSLFLREDGLLTGYFESPGTLSEAQEAMARTEVNARWQSEMQRFFLDMDGTPDTSFVLSPEIFHLEDQLAAADEASAHPTTSSPLDDDEGTAT